ncbi:MAG: M55 family metallopeptidase [Pseudomonadales bacterium]|jgi:D-amino peptidase|nr:M55 family metallopeptidase [Pseudomonadales bacterium]|tara:strand:+ start:2499 stop:3356 length:858 start_codon:yes stop_codon:yes gene_type:complete
MKVFISVDMEGISGLVRWADVSSQGIDFERNRSLMTADANAAVEGAFAAGATEVIVEENHGVEDLCVLLMDEVHPRCTVIRGAGRHGSTTAAGLDESVGVVLLVGHHGRAGSYPGIMAHTISYGMFKLVRLGGNPIGEADFFAIRAGELGVPIGMVSGDQIAAEQVSAICPWAETVIVKEALGNQSGHCIPPTRARPMIQAGAECAVKRAMAGELEPFTAISGPYNFEVELRNPVSDNMRENLNSLDEFEILDDKVIGITAPNMNLGFRRVAYLGYADRAGVTKY